MQLLDSSSLVPAWPSQFNLCDYYLDHNIREGRAERVCLTCEGESLTFGALLDRVKRLTVSFRAFGIRPEERVLIVLPDGPEFVETWFSTLRAGGVFAMVNPLLKRDAYEAYLEYTKARIVVTCSEALAELGPAAAEAEWCEQILVVGEDVGEFRSYESAMDVDPNSPAAKMASTGPDHLAGWLFTSGSTGMPKACVHVHSDFAYSTETYAKHVVGYREDDVCLSIPKLFFGYATGTNLMFPFRAGASVVLFPDRSTADELLKHIRAHRPTVLTSVPTMINNMLRTEGLTREDLVSLRLSLSAGEALPAKLYEEWLEFTGVEILDGIGSAEMFHIYISNYPGDVRIGSLGKLVPGYDAQIVDSVGREVEDGEPGRLRIRGGSTALCYWNDKGKSRETYQGEWCTTADVFRRDEAGYYYYEGREDDLLKVSGIWVSPLEIENLLLAHPHVEEVCVLGKDDEQGLVKPVAFVVLAQGVQGGEEIALELKRHAKEALAPYKYPRWFEWRESLPKNDRGKIARKILREELEARR